MWEKCEILKMFVCWECRSAITKSLILYLKGRLLQKLEIKLYAFLFSSL